MPLDPSAEQQVLLRALNRQREHVLEAVDGLGTDDLRRQVLPSGWSCIGLVNHLSLEVLPVSGLVNVMVPVASNQ